MLESLFYKFADLQLYQKQTLQQVFSCECWKIFKNSYFYRTLPVVVSATSNENISPISYMRLFYEKISI